MRICKVQTLYNSLKQPINPPKYTCKNCNVQVTRETILVGTNATGYSYSCGCKSFCINGKTTWETKTGRIVGD